MIVYSFIIILLIVFVYFSFLLFLSNQKLANSKTGKSSLLPVTLIISIKNEEQNVSGLIENLRQLNYPKENLEIILIDDNSSDRTFEMLNSLSKDSPVLRVLKAENKSLAGKKGALSVGISHAKNSYIMITDADCRPEEYWLQFAAQKFSEGYDFIFGVAPFYTDDSYANKISCFENLRNSILSFGLAGTGIYYSAAARNFGFKKESFVKIKGYSNTIETLSGDDDLLIREAVKNKLKIGMVTNAGSMVFSSAKKSLTEYFAQRSRHTKTSFYYLPKTKLILGLWHLSNLIMLGSVVFTFITPMFLIPFLLKLLTDIILIKNLQKTFGYNFGIMQIIILQITYEIILVINFLNAALRKDVWK